MKPAVLVDMWPSCGLTCMGGRVGGERRGETARRHPRDRGCGAARGRAEACTSSMYIEFECTSVLWDSGARWKLEDGSTGDGPEMSMAWLDS